MLRSGGPATPPSTRSPEATGRYDRLRLLEPDGRDAQSGYRYYTRGQTGAARAIALL